jgi:glycosyltransferase involved in cell wall biosynthesis
MKTLLLAPQPFYVERGTPIAVRCLATEFSRLGWQVDLLTFHEGTDVQIANVRIVRIPPVPGIRRIGPGFSLKKLLCDVVMFAKALSMVRRGGYRYVHAVEEAVFMAAAARAVFGVPYVYDMDSAMADQILEKWPRLRFLRRPMKWFEAMAVRRAVVVVPVCESLSRIAAEAGAARSMVLTDPPAFAATADATVAARVRRELGVSGTCLMYVGNLEAYQGVGLLLQAFAIAVGRGVDATLVIVGGNSADVTAYRAKAESLRIDARTRFFGPRPLGEMGDLVAASDVLVSPRLTGVNTPMKVYAYLNSGKAILATDIESHSQVLTSDFAVLEPPDPDRFADGICQLAANPGLRDALACRAAAVAKERYSQEAFAATVRRFGDLMESLTGA